jgi:hypothetical protein
LEWNSFEFLVKSSCPESKCSAVFSTLWSEWNLDVRTNYLLQVAKYLRHANKAYAPELANFQPTAFVRILSLPPTHLLLSLPLPYSKEGKKENNGRADAMIVYVICVGRVGPGSDPFLFVWCDIFA